MRVCKRDGCDNELTGRKDQKYCGKKCRHAAWAADNEERLAEYQSAYAAANKERLTEYKAEWHIKNRSRMLELSAEWYRNNKASHNASSANYAAANKERLTEYKAEWNAANPEKRRAAHARRRAAKAFAVFQFWVRHPDHDDSLCYWCGSDEIAHVEHVMPISLGGPATESNEVPSCADCNLRKSAKHPLVWIAELIERA
jgi:YgiT-type zinc finger domain-containing protein